MDSNHRLPRLKTAASNFIDTVLRANQDVAEVSISIVPFSTQVSAGPGILAHFNRQFAHGLSHCVDFGIADFRTADIDLSRSYTQTTHFDTFTDSATPIQWPVCPAVASLDRRILYQSSSADALKGLIGSFAARGNTSIDLGVKWGSFLLDPSSRPVVAAGVSAGTVDADLAGRPLDYGQDDGMKVLIVMSDGANTSQFAMKPGFAAGPSPVWRDPQSKRLSIYDTSRNEWYWQDNSSAKTKPYDNDDNPYNGIGDPVRLDYVELWRDYSLDWLDDAFGRFDSIVYRPEIETRTAEKDSRTHDICSATKAAGIIVFAIGFEADAAGDATLRDCASSDAHFFDVEGLEIEQAFRAISSTINRLRLSS